MAITTSQWEGAITSKAKTHIRNSRTFSCIKRSRVEDDEQAPFHSASRWWQTTRVASAWEAMLSYYWCNVKPVAGMVWFEGDILMTTRQGWCILMEHNRPQRNHGPSLAAIQRCSRPPERSSIHFGGRQLHTTQSATLYGLPDSLQCEPNAAQVETTYYSQYLRLFQ